VTPGPRRLTAPSQVRLGGDDDGDDEEEEDEEEEDDDDDDDDHHHHHADVGDRKEGKTCPKVLNRCGCGVWQRRGLTSASARTSGPSSSCPA
jgi:hypothetical protein